jgi:proteasome lid subunit RPN8/RPN11
VLTLTAEQWAQMCAHLTAQLPNEACGLLAGRAGRIDKVYLITNAQASPVRYEMEPGELIEAILEMERADWELLGIFHSHPAGPPTPSPTDVAQAYYPDSAYLICSPGAENWQGRAFEIRDGSPREILLTIEAATTDDQKGS